MVIDSSQHNLQERMAVEKAKSADQIYSCQHWPKTRINCIVSRSGFRSTTSVTPTSQTAQTSSAEVYTSMHIHRPLCDCFSAVHSLRWCRGWSSTASGHAHSGGYSSSILSINTAKNQRTNCDSGSPWIRMCAARSSHCADSAVDIAGVVRALWCDAFPNDGGFGCSSDIFSPIGWR